MFYILLKTLRIATVALGFNWEGNYVTRLENMIDVMVSYASNEKEIDREKESRRQTHTMSGRETRNER
jgi:transcriptional regulator with PAS, ATPase and Fis domain